MRSRKVYHEDSLHDVLDEMDEGEQRSGLICPECGGGNSGEASLSVYKEDGGRGTFFCHRDGCGYRGGIVNAGAYHRNAVAKSTSKKREKYQGKLFAFSPYHYEFFQDRFELDETTIQQAGWRHTTNDRFIYMPCFDKDQTLTGCVLKNYPNFNIIEYDGPKSLTRKYTGNQVRCLYPRSTSPTLFVVEDSVSALKIWQAGGNSCALLGTSMSYPLAEYLAGIYDDVVFYLDNDAGFQSNQLCRQYRMMFKSVRSLFLPRDAKDTPRHELDQLVRAMVQNS